MKSKYKENVLSQFDRIKAWARDGVTEKEIAKRLDVAYSSFREYKDKYPALAAILKKEKAVYDDSVVDALYNSTLGGIVKLKKVFKLKKKIYENGKVIAEEEYLEEREVEEYYPPNTMAQIYWLNNRRPSEWRQKVEQDDASAKTVVKDALSELVKAINDGSKEQTDETLAD